MKQSIIYKSICYLGIFLSFMSCSNEDSGIPIIDNRMSIHVSIKDQSSLTRSLDPTEILPIEKIQRYDIFMFPHTENDTTVSMHLGPDATYTADTEFTRYFDSDGSIKDPQDVFVIINQIGWDTLDEEDFMKFRKDSLKSLAVYCRQNYTGGIGSMTAFNGYKNNDGHEPFIMSASKESHNFEIQRTLSLSLERTYARVLFQFTTALESDKDEEWHCLKSVYINGFNNIPDTAYVFGQKLPSKLYSYTYASGKAYPFNVDLTGKDAGKNTLFDTFQDGWGQLRVFPHSPGNSWKEEATSIDLTFELGPIGDTSVTSTFRRSLLVGNPEDKYSIKPNTAYLITIETNKTDNDIKVNTQVVPWNLVSADFPITPNK